MNLSLLGDKLEKVLSLFGVYFLIYTSYVLYGVGWFFARAGPILLSLHSRYFTFLSKWKDEMLMKNTKTSDLGEKIDKRFVEMTTSPDPETQSGKGAKNGEVRIGPALSTQASGKGSDTTEKDHDSGVEPTEQLASAPS